ncbi:MAG TPA: type II toxin-antitoxin system VapC family toxin [Candidatus Yonathbacteria bacterium]|nr:type II toxin-antitoxin system VapC family toxin [Candidatus Yonathbacteria bacterium]
MMIFDSNVWIAFLNKSDTQHKKAEKIFASVDSVVVIPEYVILEVCSVLAMRVGKKEADGFMDMIFENKDVKVVLSCPVFFMKTVGIFKDYSKGKLSFVDCALLYFSSEYEVVTFDKCLDKAIKKTKEG